MSGWKRSHEQAGLAQTGDENTSGQLNELFVPQPPGLIVPPGMTVAPTTGQGYQGHGQEQVAVNLTMHNNEGDGQSAQVEVTNQAAGAQQPAGEIASGPAKKRRKSDKPRKPRRTKNDPPPDHSADVRKKFKLLKRSAQACDRCRERKMTCDNGRLTCKHCAKANEICVITDRITNRPIARGYLERVEDYASEIYEQVINLQLLLAGMRDYSAAQDVHINELWGRIMDDTRAMPSPLSTPEDVFQRVEETRSGTPFGPVEAPPPRPYPPSDEGEQQQQQQEDGDDDDNDDDDDSDSSEGNDSAAAGASDVSDVQAPAQVSTQVSTQAPAQAMPAIPQGAAAQIARRTVQQRQTQRNTRTWSARTPPAQSMAATTTQKPVHDQPANHPASNVPPTANNPDPAHPVRYLPAVLYNPYGIPVDPAIAHAYLQQCDPVTRAAYLQQLAELAANQAGSNAQNPISLESDNQPLQAQHEDVEMQNSLNGQFGTPHQVTPPVPPVHQTVANVSQNHRKDASAQNCLSNTNTNPNHSSNEAELRELLRPVAEWNNYHDQYRAWEQHVAAYNAWHRQQALANQYAYSYPVDQRFVTSQPAPPAPTASVQPTASIQHSQHSQHSQHNDTPRATAPPDPPADPNMTWPAPIQNIPIPQLTAQEIESAINNVEGAQSGLSSSGLQELLIDFEAAERELFGILNSQPEQQTQQQQNLTANPANPVVTNEFTNPDTGTGSALQQPAQTTQFDPTLMQGNAPDDNHSQNGDSLDMGEFLNFEIAPISGGPVIPNDEIPTTEPLDPLFGLPEVAGDHDDLFGYNDYQGEL